MDLYFPENVCALCHLLRQEPHAKSSAWFYRKRERWVSKRLNCRVKNICLSYPNKRTQTHYDSVVNKKLYEGTFNSVVLNRREFCVLLKSLFVTSRGYYSKLHASRYFSMQILPALRSGKHSRNENVSRTIDRWFYFSSFRKSQHKSQDLSYYYLILRVKIESVRKDSMRQVKCYEF
jgi:hypothetical protein